MSIMVQQFKHEPVDLSDSDSDRLQIEESSSTCDVDDDKRVRRSSRQRRTSTRFFDFFTGEEEIRTKREAQAPRNVKNRTAPNVMKPKPEPVHKEPEPIDPKYLIRYVEKTKKVVSPGEYSVKLPVGPDEYVTQDGAEYLKGLGYYNSLIEEEVVEIEPQRGASDEVDPLSNRVVFEAQTAMMTKSTTSDPTIPFDQGPSPSKFLRIKEVVEPDQFSSASAYSTDEDRDSEGGGEEIDIMGSSSPPRVETPTPPTPLSRVVRIPRKTYKKLSKIKGIDLSSDLSEYISVGIPENIRSIHNLNEQKRRKQLAECFEYVKSCIIHGGTPFPYPDKVPKVKLLADAATLIAELRSRALMSTAHLEQLKAENIKLQEEFEKLLEQQQQKKLEFQRFRQVTIKKRKRPAEAKQTEHAAKKQAGPL